MYKPRYGYNGLNSAKNEIIMSFCNLLVKRKDACQGENKLTFYL